MAIGVGIPEHLKKKLVEKPDLSMRKGWATPYGFIDFTVPVSFEHACETMKKMQAKFTDFYGEK